MNHCVIFLRNQIIPEKSYKNKVDSTVIATAAVDDDGDAYVDNREEVNLDRNNNITQNTSTM